MTGTHETWPVYVINMADNHLRMDICSAELSNQNIDFKRFDAIVGRDLTQAEISQSYDAKANMSKFRHKLIAGELGCYLSHIAIWKTLVASEYEGAVILEDDFAASPHLAETLKALSTSTADWDLVKLFSRLPDKKMIHSMPLCDGVTLDVPYQIPNTTLGYVIRRKAAERLLARSVPFARPIDEDHKRFWEHGLKVGLVQPSPLHFGQEAHSAGTIQAARKSTAQSSAGAKVRQGFKTLGYRFGYLLALHLNRFLTRKDASIRDQRDT